MTVFKRSGFALIALAMLLAVTAVACSDDETAPAAQVIDVTIHDDSVDVEPDRIRIGDTFEVVVANESETDCTFHLGEYVRDLEAPAGETTSSVIFEAVTVTGDRIDVGCEDEARQRSVDLLNIE
ncbi:MAG: hypothetical protein R3C39_13030 [Dehalococcoidia bacterium]